MRFTKLFIIILLILVFQSSSLQSKSYFLNSKFNIRFGSSLINSKMDEAYSEKAPMLYGSISYNINEIFELGIYAGSGKMMHSLDLPYNEAKGLYEWYSKDSISIIRSSVNGISGSSKHLRYGLISEIHLMPLFNIHKSRFDIYIQPQLGLITENYEVLRDYSEYIWSKPVAEYGLGLGLRYRFSKSFGAFTDYSIGKYYNQDKNKLKIGLAFTF